MSLREVRRTLGRLREPPGAKYARWRRRSPLVRLLTFPAHVPLARLPGLLWRFVRWAATRPAGDGADTGGTGTAARGGGVSGRA